MRAFRTRVNGGLYDSAPVADRSKRQNPHMHLLEAYIALEIAAPGRGYLERAKKLIEIFKTRLFLADPGVLLEYFAEDWSSHPDPLKRRIFEPGHHFEWVWLLSEYEKLSGDDLSPWIHQLDGVARRCGVAENGLIFDELDADMRVLKRAHRILAAYGGRQSGCRDAPRGRARGGAVRRGDAGRARRKLSRQTLRRRLDRPHQRGRDAARRLRARELALPSVPGGGGNIARFPVRIWR